MEHYDEVQDFIQAVKNQDVCIMGSFCTQIIHNKWLFKILREEPTLSLLTEEEQKFVHDHIPYTNLINEKGFLVEMNLDSSILMVLGIEEANLLILN